MSATRLWRPAPAVPIAAAASPSTPPLPPIAPAAAARLSVIIPVYNERHTLPELLDRVSAQRLEWEGRPVELEVVVVDDCSSDGGADFLELPEARQRFPVIRLIRHPGNRGKGAAIRTGLTHATGNVVLIQDADLEYNPDDYGRMLAPILRQETQVVYGSRFMGRPLWSRPPGMHRANWLCNKLLSWTATLLFGRSITDEATCYKVMDRALVGGLQLRAERFDFCPEVTAKLLRRGQRIVEVPIAYQGRGTNEGKKIRWTDAFHAWFTLVRYRLFP